jgi:hypothetical protein
MATIVGPCDEVGGADDFASLWMVGCPDRQPTGRSCALGSGVDRSVSLRRARRVTATMNPATPAAIAIATPVANQPVERLIGPPSR